MGEQGFPVHVLHSKEDVNLFIKNAKENTTTPVPERSHIQGADYTLDGFVLATGFRQDDDDPHHHCGTIRGEDINHSAQESSGDGVGRGGKEVVSPQAPKSVQDYGQPDAEIVRLDFGSGRLFD